MTPDCGVLPVQVKICGLVRPEDCLAVNAARADYAGFVLTGSRRQVTPKQAAALIRLLNPAILPVGVFTEEPSDQIARLAARLGLQVVQLHAAAGRIASVRRLLPPGIRIWQSLAVPVGLSPDKARAHIRTILAECLTRQALPDAWLLDSCQDGRAGGTGRVLDWSALRAIGLNRPLVLAGGLSAENVGTAISCLRPAVVDCSSGVECDGRKNPAKIDEFCRASKRRHA